MVRSDRSRGTAAPVLPLCHPCHFQRPCDAVVVLWIGRGGRGREAGTARCDLARWQTRCPSVLGACLPPAFASKRKSHRVFTGAPRSWTQSFSLSPGSPPARPRPCGHGKRMVMASALQCRREGSGENSLPVAAAARWRHGKISRRLAEPPRP